MCHLKDPNNFQGKRNTQGNRETDYIQYMLILLHQLKSLFLILNKIDSNHDILN